MALFVKELLSADETRTNTADLGPVTEPIRNHLIYNIKQCSIKIDLLVEIYGTCTQAEYG